MSTETANPFLTWAPPGKSLVIHLDYSAIQRMNVEVMRGFGVTRRRGTETGGVLIGRIDRLGEQPLIHIQDFEVVPCEYASGPSYALSPTDEQRFRETVAKWQPSLDRGSYAVGHFRSHTRSGFELDEKDAALTRQFFPDPLDVVLLVKPFATRPATAGFFLKSGDGLVTDATPLEFLFESPTPTVRTPVPITSANTPTVAPPPVNTASPVVEKVARPSRAPRIAPQLSHERDLFTQQPETSGWMRGLSWTAFCLALLAFGAVCGYEYAGGHAQDGGKRPGVSAGSASDSGLPNASLYTVNLQAAPTDGGVMVRWNRDSVPIQAALRGVLTITEGAASKEVKLGFAELRNGAALYLQAAPQVRFRLEIFFKDNRSFAETIEYARPASGV